MRKIPGGIILGLCIMAQSMPIVQADDVAGYTKEVQQSGVTAQQYKQILDIPAIANERTLSTATAQTELSTTEQKKVVATAKKYVGVPYKWGGTTPAGFDCSGLVQYVYRTAVGVNLSRTTTQQAKSGTAVSLNALQPGDILFFGSKSAPYHDAIYIGNNQYIHAPEPGQKVKIISMKYYQPDFARRILKTATPAVQTKSKLETFRVTADQIQIKGWHIATNTTASQARYLIIKDATTNKEIKRIKINRVTRTDIAKAYPNIANAKSGGFSIAVPLYQPLLNQKIKVVSRYAKDAAGATGANDVTFTSTIQTPSRLNTGKLEVLKKTSAKTLEIKGWHLSTYTTSTPTHFLYFIDKKTGKQLKQITVKNSQRTDIARTYPKQPNAQTSGFSAKVDTSKWKGKTIVIRSRYTKDSQGKIQTDQLTYTNSVAF